MVLSSFLMLSFIWIVFFFFFFSSNPGSYKKKRSNKYTSIFFSILPPQHVKFFLFFYEINEITIFFEVPNYSKLSKKIIFLLHVNDNLKNKKIQCTSMDKMNGNYLQRLFSSKHNLPLYEVHQIGLIQVKEEVWTEPEENPVHPDSFTWIYILFKI